MFYYLYIILLMCRRAQGFSMQNSLEMFNRVESDDFMRHYVLNKINSVKKIIVFQS